jgi:AcrR family transcriptional regulator
MPKAALFRRDSPAPTRERILEAASELLARDGAVAVTLRGVAKAAKLTPMALYHHFPELSDLRQALVDREILRFVDFVHATPRPKGHAARFIHQGDAYARFALQFPKTFLFLFGESRPSARQYPEGFKDSQSPSLNLLAGLVRDAMNDGFIRRCDVWELTFHLWAHTHGFVMLYLAGRISLSPEEFLKMLQRCSRQLLYGLKT